MVNVILTLLLGYGYLLKNMYVSKMVKNGQIKYLLYFQLLILFFIECLLCFVNGVAPKWNYIMQTMEYVSSLFQPLEEAIHQH